MTVLLIAVGALAGAPLRLCADRLAAAWRGHGSVLGTLVVNVVGSVVLGLVLGIGVPAPVLALVGTGFCGTLTTFSTFGFDVVRLVERREVRRALGYLAATLAVGLGAGAAAYALGSALAR